MLKSVKSFVKKTPLAVPFIYLKGRLTKPRTQNDEAQILSALIGRYPIPKLFVEFGFGGWEFNCAPLAYDWDGLLLDGDAYNVKIARTILPSRVRALHAWLTLETLGPIREFVAGRDLGILSVDIDGNDYWLLEDLIDLKPAMIIAEYNTTFGLRSITVPYDPDFDCTSHDAGFTTVHRFRPWQSLPDDTAIRSSRWARPGSTLSSFATTCWVRRTDRSIRSKPGANSPSSMARVMSTAGSESSTSRS